MDGEPDRIGMARGGTGSVASVVAGVAALLWATLLSACGALERLGETWRGGPPPHILLVTIDTARADRFGGKGLTPNLDRIAAQGTVFLQAVAPTPLTLPSHASLLTGTLPPVHGVRNNGTYRLSDDAVTLAELLSAGGYRTAAFLGAEVLDSRHGLDQGFEHYDDRVDPVSPALAQFRRRRAEAVTEAALVWLAQQRNDPTFVWVHFFDPHHPYDPPEPERTRFGDRLYDGEIAYVDRVIGDLFRGYQQLGRFDDALVVVTADHGESLGEHGEASHGVFVYDAAIRIPLIIRGGGFARGATVRSQVQLIDVHPTIAGLVGLEAPDRVQGRNLAGLADPEQPPQAAPAAYLESLLPRENYGWAALRAVRTGDWKLIQGAGFELYDLRGDPEELRDVGAREAERVQALSGLLQSLSSPRESDPATRIELEPESRKRLEAIGYVWTSGGDPEAPGVLPDPRARIAEFVERDYASDRLMEAGRLDEALAELQGLMQDQPGNPATVAKTVAVLARLGRSAEAVAVCQRLLQLAPWDAQAWLRCGTAYKKIGQLEPAAQCYARATEIAPWNPAGWSLHGRLLLEAGDPAAAATVFEGAAQAGAADPETTLLLAQARLMQGDADGAGDALSQTWEMLRNAPPELGPPPPRGIPPSGARARYAELAGRVGELCASQLEFALAVRAYAVAAELVPSDARIHYNLGLARERSGAPERASQDYRRALALDPQLEPARRRLEALSRPGGR